MRRWLLLLACLLLAGCSSLGLRQRDMLHYDGIYRSDRIVDGAESYWYYLRFYPDGAVIDTSTEGTPADLRSWFNRSMDDPSVGHVQLHGTHIAFSQTSREGTVDYQGTIVGNALHLSSHSRINGADDSHVYTFIAWPAEAPAAASAQP